jgi:hypothetical protein
MSDSSPASPPPSGRPRPQLLGLLAVAAVALIVYMMWPAAGPGATPSNSPREQRRQAAVEGTAGASGTLDVQLDALKQPPPAPEGASRNPFRFYVKPPPPPPPPPKAIGPGDKGYVAPLPPPPPPPAGPPPIPLKFIGTLEVKGRKVAIFQTSDRPGMPIYAGEGEVLLGQYRLVKIGVESATLEYLDGRGRQTIPMRG